MDPVGLTYSMKTPCDGPTLSQAQHMAPMRTFPATWPHQHPGGLAPQSVLSLPLGRLPECGEPSQAAQAASEDEIAPLPQPSWNLRDHTKPELLHGIPKAFHVGPPALEEVQLSSVASLEDLQRRWTFHSDTLEQT